MLHLRSMKWPVGGELELGPANEQVTGPVLALFSLFFFLNPHSHGYMPTLFLCMSSVAGRDRGIFVPKYGRYVLLPLYFCILTWSCSHRVSPIN